MPAGSDGSVAVDWQERRVGGAAKQPIEFVQLAALALPADPLSFAFVPDAPAMQEKEARAVVGRPVALVQPRNSGGAAPRRLSSSAVVLGLAIGPVGQQRECEIFVRIGEMVNLQSLDLLFDRRYAGEQRRHDDDRAQIGRERRRAIRARAEAVPPTCWVIDAVHDRDRDVRSRNRCRQSPGHSSGQPATPT